MCCGAQDADPSRVVLDHRQDVHACSAQCDRFEEVTCQQGLGSMRRKLADVLEARSGAGSMPASLRISHTVEAATFTPRTRSSPCARR